MSRRDTLVPNPLLTGRAAIQREDSRGRLIRRSLSVVILFAVAVIFIAPNKDFAASTVGTILAAICALFIVTGVFSIALNLSILVRLPRATVPAWRALIPLDIPDSVTEENLLTAVDLRREACYIVEGIILTGSPATPEDDRRLDEINAEINELLSQP